MKARFLVLAAMMLGLASCQTEPEGLNVNVGGEVDTFVTVTIPETETRAGGLNSALGAFENVDLNGTNGTDYTVRYIFEVYYGETGVQKQVLYSDSKSVSFPVRLVPGRNYNFVAWADIAEQPADAKMNKALAYESNTTDVHYNTTNLQAISLLGEWKAMDETRDAYSGFYNTADYTNNEYTGSSSINIRMTRPFAKLRVITTDMVELGNLHITPVSAKVTYSAFSHESFNALDGTYSGEISSKTHTYTIANYADQSGANKVLFTDYFFADDNDVVKFELDVYEAGEQNATTLIKHNDFKTDIPAQRNYLTTIKGNILTEGNNITVEVKDAFENGSTWNPTEDEYDYATISSEAEFFAAVNGNGGQYILISDIDVDGVYASTNAATRTSTNKTVNINLNGKTITVNNDGTDALISLADGAALIFSGEGDIIGSGKLAEEGANVVVTDAVAVDSDVTGVKTGLDALVYICANGGEFTFANNLEADSPLAVTTTKPVVINGNGKTITYTGSDRAFNVNGLETANVTLNDLTFVNSAKYCQRGINFNVAGKLTLNNVTVGKTGTPATYAINLPGSSDNTEVEINNSYLKGNIALNIWGENVLVNALNSTFISYDAVEAENYAAIVLNNDGETYAENAVINIEGGKIIARDQKNEASTAVQNSTIHSKINISNTTEVVGSIYEPQAVVMYNGSTDYYSCDTLQEAINKAAETPTSATVRLFKDIELSSLVTVDAVKTVTIDLNNYTISGKTNGTTNPQDLFLVKGNLTVKNGTITAEHIGDNLGWSAQGTIFDITAGGVVNLNGVTAKHLGGTDMNFVAHLNNWGEATLNVENSTLEATYIAVRVFNSGPDMNNVSIKNTTLKGKYCFWVHNYNAAGDNCGYGGGTDATLNIDIFNGTNTFEYTGIAPVLYGFNNPIYYVLRDNGNAIYKQYSNEAKIVKYNGNADTFNVESAINDVTVTTIGNRAFKNAVVSTVELPSSITTLEEGAFQGAAIKSITIPENVTVLGKQSIGYCPELETIVINAKNVTIDNYIARACAKLKSVYIYSENVEFINKSMYFTNKENADASAITFYVSSEAVAKKVYEAQSTSHSYGIKIVSIDGATTYYNTLK